MGLIADLQSVRLVHDLLIQAEGVLALSLGRLIIPEPLDQLLLLRVRDVADVLHVRRVLCIRAHDKHLPVRLAVVHQGEDTEDPHGHDLADRARLGVQLQHVDRVIVAADAGIWVLLVGVLPRLGDGAVVHQGANLGIILVVAQLSLLGVLDDGVVLVLLVHLHLCGRAPGDLADEVQQPLPVLRASRVRDFVPWRYLLALVRDEILVLERVGLALRQCTKLAGVEVDRRFDRRYVERALRNTKCRR
mmetsp:Transcript_87914/g.226651  ORF Transcript_87914/g.226651 Transcript_87914/m.226651 type:complete len:247 (-) Transcript_87914:124-864(-)